MKNALAADEQIIFLNGTAISGVSSMEGSFSLNYEPINTIGVGFNHQALNQVPNAQFSIKKYLLYQDPFLQYTGEAPDQTAKSFAMSLNYGDNSLGFNSGFLNSFALSCAVGQVPETDISVVVFGDFGNDYSASGIKSAPYITVPQSKNIRITCSGSESNRITDFSFSVNCPKLPIYGLLNSWDAGTRDSHIPIEVIPNLPIEINASFTLEVDDFESRNLFSIINGNDNLNFSIDISGQVLADTLLNTESGLLEVSGEDNIIVYQQYERISLFYQTFENAKLISQDMSSDSDDVLSVRLTYKAYLN